MDSILKKQTNLTLAEIPYSRLEIEFGILINKYFDKPNIRKSTKVQEEIYNLRQELYLLKNMQFKECILDSDLEPRNNILWPNTNIRIRTDRELDAKGYYITSNPFIYQGWFQCNNILGISEVFASIEKALWYNVKLTNVRDLITYLTFKPSRELHRAS